MCVDLLHVILRSSSAPRKSTAKENKTSEFKLHVGVSVFLSPLQVHCSVTGASDPIQFMARKWHQRSWQSCDGVVRARLAVNVRLWKSTMDSWTNMMVQWCWGDQEPALGSSPRLLQLVDLGGNPRQCAGEEMLEESHLSPRVALVESPHFSTTF